MPQNETPRRRPAQSGPVSDKPPVTPLDIQQKEFRLAFRGYNERDVDQFLDEITEEVARLHAEARQLREEMSSRGTVTLDVGGAAEADEIVRRAREEAARIVGEAETGAREIMEETGAGAARPCIWRS